ncbi:PilZ domain-containing protein [Desulfoferrobacter suflitae]|uniref:PilZ domain-containing protein n=1 Tax=Desulfoferrobacter suflitae TaxID=2865782 RepID=UPI002164BEDA|nr:PilZ domain-containing protein [Desulfoferrobacter suflitae]MCK8602071.1 PilZ domain-containing protein [Desulfoferrobacter suflitae]
MAEERVTQIRLGDSLDRRIDEALDLFNKRNPEISWDREQLIRLAVGYGLNQLFRQYVRKETNMPGVYQKLTPEGIVGNEINVENLSLGGIGFTTRDSAFMREGEIIDLEFILDNAERSVISKTAVIRKVAGDYVGAEFIEAADASDRDPEFEAYLQES